MHPRLGVWSALHDNGWRATAAETVQGVYLAWAAPDGQIGPVDYIEDGLENGKRAAQFALERKTGHTQCSRHCTGWTYAEFPLAVKRR